MTIPAIQWFPWRLSDLRMLKRLGGVPSELPLSNAPLGNPISFDFMQFSRGICLNNSLNNCLNNKLVPPSGIPWIYHCV